jgi:hypothetical protein
MTKKDGFSSRPRFGPALVPHKDGTHDPPFDQANEFMMADIVPPQVLTALAALAEGPRVTREPRVLQRWHTGLAATGRPGKSDNLEPDPLRVGEGELVLAFVLKPVPLIGYPLQAPRAKPSPRGIRVLNHRSALQPGRDYVYRLRSGRG